MRKSIELFPTPAPGVSWTEVICKGVHEQLTSQQDNPEGEVPHPFDMAAVVAFRNANAHHAACLSAKATAISGLGFVSDKVGEALDPLCERSAQDLLDSVTDDRVATGNGYIEVIRREDGSIGGLYHVQAPRVYKEIERDGRGWHWVVKGGRDGGSKHYAQFGEADDLAARATDVGIQEGDLAERAEIIHLRRPTSLHRDYGVAPWIAAVPCVEVVQQILQHNHDFFYNRAIPDFLLLFMGDEMNNAEWKKVKGLVNDESPAGKTGVLQISNPEMRVEMHKLATEIKDGYFGGMLDSLAGMIVSAHQVPPQLAGILVPGKLGSSNELRDSMKVFQALVVGPEQRSMQCGLGCSLGNPELNGGLGLTEEDFEFKTILEEIGEPEEEEQANIQTESEPGEGGEDSPAPASLTDGDLRKSLSTPEQVGQALGATMIHVLRGGAA